MRRVAAIAFVSALAIFAQTADREAVMGQYFIKELGRKWKIVETPEAIAALAQSLSAHLSIEAKLVESDQPLANNFPGGGVYRGLRRRRADHAPGGCRESRHRRARRRLPGVGRPQLLGWEWPEQPSLRFLVHWALRRDDLCDPKLCPDTLDDGDRCDHCPLDKLDGAQSSEAGLLIRRALDLRAALKLGIHVGLDDIRADEFYAMLILEDERDRLDRETLRQN